MNDPTPLLPSVHNQLNHTEQWQTIDHNFQPFELGAASRDRVCDPASCLATDACCCSPQNKPTSTLHSCSSASSEVVATNIEWEATLAFMQSQGEGANGSGAAVTHGTNGYQPCDSAPGTNARPAPETAVGSCEGSRCHPTCRKDDRHQTDDPPGNWLQAANICESWFKLLGLTMHGTEGSDQHIPRRWHEPNL